MGVIRWEVTEPGPYEDYGVMWHGYLGDDCICFVADFGPSVELDGVLHLGTHREFPGLSHDERRTPCGTVERGKHLAEMLLHGWMTDVGLVSKAELDEARRSAAWYISALRDAEAASKRRYEEIRDLEAENDRLERVLKKIRREISREANRDIYGRFMRIVNDAHAWAKGDAA